MDMPVGVEVEELSEVQNEIEISEELNGNVLESVPKDVKYEIETEFVPEDEVSLLPVEGVSDS